MPLPTPAVYERRSWNRIIVSSRSESLRKIQAQFRHARTLESILRLAAGVAHDFNNLLTVIRDTAHNCSTAPRIPAKRILD